jgi:putative DNA methylase
MAIETSFDVSFVARLTAEENQIQQNYRPVIGVHKWFARRPGALFRSLLLSEFANGTSLAESYYQGHSLAGITVADPFMGGGTTLFEANRVGCNVVGFDINSMAFWIVRQELVSIDR